MAVNVRSVLRMAVLGAVAVAGLAGCTRTEVTETSCVPVPDETLAGPSDETDTVLECNTRRYQLIYRDKYSEEREVVTDNTW